MKFTATLKVYVDVEANDLREATDLAVKAMEVIELNKTDYPVDARIDGTIVIDLISVAKEM